MIASSIVMTDAASAERIFNIPSGLIFFKPVSLCIIYAANIKFLLRLARSNAYGLHAGSDGILLIIVQTARRLPDGAAIAPGAPVSVFIR